MSELRLVLEPPEPIKTPPDIQAALDLWAAINKKPNIWATFEAIQFEHERVVRVELGIIHSDGTKERAYQTITYNLRKDGLIDCVKHTHP